MTTGDGAEAAESAASYGVVGGAVAEALVSLRVAGAWSGVLEVPLQRWTVAELRAEASRRSGFDVKSINLISAGKNLKDTDCLRELGLRANSKLLMTRIGRQQAGQLIKEKERVERLARIKAAADLMSKRSDDNSFPSDEYDIELQNQNGEPLKFNSDSDRRALVMGLMLHAKARTLIKEGQYKEALEVLGMAEESFLLGDPKMLEAVDNVPLLQVDIVWCLFMQSEIGCLGIAKERLAKARDGLRRSHGRNLERLRVLQGGFSPELATYVRLELLEGVVAYHSGNYAAAWHTLLSAQNKFKQLHVSDESLVSLASMGFSPTEAKRALRVSGQNVERAVEFVVAQKQKEQEKVAQDRQRRKERREQKLYGRTKSGKAVDLKQLNALLSLGYETFVVAEALKQSDNDSNGALDILSDPVLYDALQASLASSKRLKQTVDEADLNELIQMGFSREKAIKALQASPDMERALEKLIQTGSSSLDASTSNDPAADATEQMKQTVQEEHQNEQHRQERDVEMEDEIAENLKGDAYEAYDLEVDLEGNAIAEYLRLVESVMGTECPRVPSYSATSP